jgi:hypothetical protein
MIKEVLKLVQDGGMLSMTDITDKIGIQESTLTSILSLLFSKGYLKTIETSEETLGGGCIGCSMNKKCNKSSSGGVYIITEKGKKYLQKN